jgi:hypothetical protein
MVDGNLAMFNMSVLNSNYEPEGYWFCNYCQAEVSEYHVTYDETHDIRSGGCGQSVEWIEEEDPGNGVQE